VGALKAEGPAAPLPERLRELAAAVDAAPDTLSVQMEVLGAPPRLSNDSDVALFRAAQEGLTNVRKHAAAHRAVITLDGRRPDRVVLSVVDDGRGAPPDRQGHGLAGLRERLGAVGGEVRAGNEPGGGFRLEAHVPVPVA
jgi:signal transduction histidine kinase